MISQELLKHLLDYNPETGIWKWKVSASPRVKVGEPAGHWENNGYLRIRVMGGYYLASRLAFLYMEGKMPTRLVDHINQDRSDNRWTNLRECSRSQNNTNIPKKSNNTSGFRGVHWHKASQKWAVNLRYQKKTINGGVFESFEEAKRKRIELEKLYHKEFSPTTYGT